MFVYDSGLKICIFLDLRLSVVLFEAKCFSLKTLKKMYVCIYIAAAQGWVGSGLFLANLGNSEQQTGE